MSKIDKATEEAIAMKAELTRLLAEEAGFEGKTENRDKELALWGEYKAFCWIEELLGIDWAKYNHKAVQISNRIRTRAKGEEISEEDLDDEED